jgi:hypothetical protein
VGAEEFGFSLGAGASIDVFAEGREVAVSRAIIEIHVFGFLFSVSISGFARGSPLACCHSLPDFADVNKKSKKIFLPRHTIFLYTGSKSAEPHEC